MAQREDGYCFDTAQTCEDCSTHAMTRCPKGHTLWMSTFREDIALAISICWGESHGGRRCPYWNGCHEAILRVPERQRYGVHAGRMYGSRSGMERHLETLSAVR